MGVPVCDRVAILCGDSWLCGSTVVCVCNRLAILRGDFWLSGCTVVCVVTSSLFSEEHIGTAIRC